MQTRTRHETGHSLKIDRFLEKVTGFAQFLTDLTVERQLDEAIRREWLPPSLPGTEGQVTLSLALEGATQSQWLGHRRAFSGPIQELSASNAQAGADLTVLAKPIIGEVAYFAGPHRRDELTEGDMKVDVGQMSEGHRVPVCAVGEVAAVTAGFFPGSTTADVIIHLAHVDVIGRHRPGSVYATESAYVGLRSGGTNALMSSIVSAKAEAVRLAELR